MNKSPKKPAKAAMTQINGREEKKVVLTTLEQVWGRDPSDKYGTVDESEYRTKLDDMSRTDLWRHATRVGFPPHDNISALKQKLLGEFRKFISQQTASSLNNVGPNRDTTQIPDHIKKILSD